MLEAYVLPDNLHGTGPVDEEISPQPCWFVSLREWHFFDYMSGNVIKEKD